jgi:hypothetical protein
VKRHATAVLAAVAGLIVLTFGHEAAAAPEARPVRHASLELSPLALLGHRYGGQAQVGVYGPLTLVGSVSRIAIGDTQHVPHPDNPDAIDVSGAPSLTGWSFELGPRAYLPLDRRAHRIDAFFGVSYVHDALSQGAQQACSTTCDDPSRTIVTSALPEVQRNGAAFDVGIQATLASGLLFSFGAGWVVTSAHGEIAPVNDGWAALLEPSAYERMQSHPRLLATIGWSI